MKGIWGRLAAIRVSAYALVVLALALRVLIPAGVMLDPTEGRSGLSSIVICTGQGAMTVAVDDQGHVVSAEGEDGKNKPEKPLSDHPCAFAAAAAPLAAPQALDLPAPASIRIEAAPLAAFAPRPGLGLAAPPPPKTGPPAIA